MRYTLISAIIFGVDYQIKKWADAYKHLGKRCAYWKDRIVIWKYHNHGGFYNLGQGKPVLVRGLSIGLSVLSTILFLLTLTKHGSGLLKTGLAFLLGGAYSNTYDRLTKKYVVDYIQLAKVPGLGRLIFNLSDFFIVTGALFTVLACAKEDQ